MLARFVQVGRELHSDETPVPGFKYVVPVVLRIGEDETVAVSIF